ncbi:MAG TPA: hypothetical protein VN886_10220 [Acidimicrobiales bacterium]|nr:hypothetical protein [Acidimicrobiales bacterium]
MPLLMATVLALMGALEVGPSVQGPHAAAATIAYAPPDTPGPPLDVPSSVLDAAVTCSPSAVRPTRDIIVVLPPTLFDPGEAYGWNYLPAFAALGWPYCEVTVPDHSDGDIQVAAEYVVNAVRFLHASSGRQVELFGWSQGASTLPRWALRWWPDIRPMVASLVGLAPDNEYGTTDPLIESVCTYECFPAAWQETHRVLGGESNFMMAMNSDEQTFPGIAYTDIWSLTDEVAGWNVGSDKVSPLPASPTCSTCRPSRSAHCSPSSTSPSRPTRRPTPWPWPRWPPRANCPIWRTSTGHRCAPRPSCPT